MGRLENIDNLIKDNNPAEALVLLDRIVAENPSDARALFLRGKAYWRMGQRSKAMSDYASAASLDPESPAVQALEQARDVESFFNPDLLNP